MIRITVRQELVRKLGTGNPSVSTQSASRHNLSFQLCFSKTKWISCPSTPVRKRYVRQGSACSSYSVPRCAGLPFEYSEGGRDDLGGARFQHHTVQLPS